MSMKVTIYLPDDVYEKLMTDKRTFETATKAEISTSAYLTKIIRTHAENA